jgi:hypothetical protein
MHLIANIGLKSWELCVTPRSLTNQAANLIRESFLAQRRFPPLGLE